MVDPLSTSGRTPVAKTQTVTSGKPVSAPSATAATQSGAATDEVQLSQSVARLPKDLDASPPVDHEAVARIKAALADGSYQLDADKLSDALMNDYLDSKS